MTDDHQYISRKHEEDKVIVFEKGDLVFVFNFHCNNSYFDYRVGCRRPGVYKVCGYRANISDDLSVFFIAKWVCST